MGRKKIYRRFAQSLLENGKEKKVITMSVRARNLAEKLAEQIEKNTQNEEADSINFRLPDGSFASWSRESLEKVKNHPWLSS